MILRPYQTDIVARGRNRMRPSEGIRRGIIQGETGSGKSVVIGYLTKCAAEKNSRVLILADRRRLVKQIGSTLEAFGVRYGVIMSGETGATRESVILASRDTLAAWAKRPGFEMPTFNLILIDEAHKSMGETYQQILANYPAAAVIGFTATPARNDGKSLDSFFQWLECTVPASQLIAEGFLIKPDVFAPLEVAEKRKKGIAIKGLAGDPVAHWRRHADGLPTIAFASNVSESIALCERFNEAKIKAEHIDASVSDEAGYGGLSARDHFYKRLASGETKVLSSVGLLIEGVDIPEASAAILWAKFGSMVQYRQACGRIMRPAPWASKSKCIVLDHSGAAGVHGLPGDDVHWSLDLGSTLQERNAKDPKLAEPTACRGCGCVFRAPACPNCGLAAPRAERKMSAPAAHQATTDAILSRFESEQQQQIHRESRQRYWLKCIAIAKAKDRPSGMAAGMFRSKFKLAPWEAGVEPLPTNWRAPAREVFA